MRWHKGLISKASFLGINKGSKNGMWRGDNIKYIALHVWVNLNIKRVKVCQTCGSMKNIDLANIKGIYNRDFKNWKYLCRSCHMKEDGRLKNLLKR
jgi:hypothetical protein